jgi:hypothetical protein
MPGARRSSRLLRFEASQLRGADGVSLGSEQVAAKVAPVHSQDGVRTGAEAREGKLVLVLVDPRRRDAASSLATSSTVRKGCSSAIVRDIRSEHTVRPGSFARPGRFVETPPALVPQVVHNVVHYVTKPGQHGLIPGAGRLPFWKRDSSPSVALRRDPSPPSQRLGKPTLYELSYVRAGRILVPQEGRSARVTEAFRVCPFLVSVSSSLSPGA